MRVRPKIHDLPLPCAKLQWIARPELIRLNYPDGNLDIGALCYLRRSQGQVGVVAEERMVDLESLDKTRRRDVRRLIHFLVEELDEPSKRPSSILGDANSLVRFVDWIDFKLLKSPFGDSSAARRCLQEYIEHLMERVRANTLTQNTAAGYQNAIIRYLREFEGIDSPAAGLRTISKSKRKSRATEPPDDGAQAKVLAISHALFDGLLRLVVEEIPYPYRLALPSFLSFPNDSVWIFPTARWMLHPKHHQTRHLLPHPHWAYNYQEGRIAELDEIIGYSSKKVAQRQITAAEKAVATANSNAQHGRRRDAAILAHNAFVMLFVANTGMNWAQVRALPWSDEYEVEAKRQKFREIKYRAGGLIVTFTISSVFLPTFRRFLQIRSYLLDGRQHQHLFVGFGSNPTPESLPQKMSPDALEKFLNVVASFDSGIPRLLTRKWRTAKVHALIPQADVSTAAKLIQTSESTLLQHYTAGSQSVANKEMGQFFERLTSIVTQGDSSKELTPTGVGGCASVGLPEATGEVGTPTPNCRNPEGCLFCRHLVIHADEADIRKLASARFVLNLLAPLGSSKEHFDSALRPIIERTTALLSRISNEFGAAELVNQTVESVEEQGDLDSYWSARLDMLADLDVIVLP